MGSLISLASACFIAVLGWNILVHIVVPLIGFIISTIIGIVVSLITLAIQGVFLGFTAFIAFSFIKKTLNSNQANTSTSVDQDRNDYYSVNRDARENNEFRRRAVMK